MTTARMVVFSADGNSFTLAHFHLIHPTTPHSLGRDAAPSVLLVRTAAGAVFGAYAAAAWRPDAAPGRYYGDGTTFVFTLRSVKGGEGGGGGVEVAAGATRPPSPPPGRADEEPAGAPPTTSTTPTTAPPPLTTSRSLWRWHARYCSAVARNDFFQLARPGALALGGGAGGGGWALSLDADLGRGTSRACTTFGTPTGLGEAPEFGVGRVELWGLR
jgi:hypothetical protein